MSEVTSQDALIKIIPHMLQQYEAFRRIEDAVRNDEQAKDSSKSEDTMTY